jgi:hypothetical protein
VFERCQASADEFAEVAYEVEGMRVILDAIADFWKENKEIPRARMPDLEREVNGCTSVLRELYSVLNTHPNLSVSAMLHWAFNSKQIKEMRGKMKDRRTSLAQLNSLIAYVVPSLLCRSFE